MNNPFFYGTPVDKKQFFNRRKILRTVVNRLVNRGQSTAIIGEPRLGKSSLLMYLSEPDNYENLYGKHNQKIFFSLIDIQMLGGEFTQAHFWEEALAPIAEEITQNNLSDSVAKHYNICQANNFGTFTLEKLFQQINKDKLRLVLLIDEFDLILHHPILNSAEFFGSLRALASRSRGALAVVISSRQSLTTLNKETQKFNPTGSPYFNIFAEANLEAFPKKDIKELLNLAGDHFHEKDKQFIISVAGGHPYLLQATASAMWEEKEGNDIDEHRRYLTVGQRLYQETKSHYSDTWNFWPPATRKAVTAIALTQMPHLLKHRDFLTSAFLKDLPNFAPEINDLKTIGLVAEDEKIPGGYRLTQGAMLWWLADELLRNVRDDKPFEQWLRNQEMVGLLTKQEIDNLAKAAKFLGGLLNKGAVTLIEAYAKGLVS